MSKRLSIIALLLLFVISGCSKDDDDDNDNSQTISTCNSLILTLGSYSETLNLNSKINEEYGNSFSLADWNDLANISNLDNWVDCMNMSHDTSFLLERNGERFHNGGNRHYYVHYSTDGLPYSGFLVHDQIGDFYLGSWYGIEMKILALEE